MAFSKILSIKDHKNKSYWGNFFLYTRNIWNERCEEVNVGHSHIWFFRDELPICVYWWAPIFPSLPEQCFLYVFNRCTSLGIKTSCIFFIWACSLAFDNFLLMLYRLCKRQQGWKLIKWCLQMHHFYFLLGRYSKNNLPIYIYRQIERERESPFSSVFVTDSSHNTSFPCSLLPLARISNKKIACFVINLGQCTIQNQVIMSQITTQASEN